MDGRAGEAVTAARIVRYRERAADRIGGPLVFHSVC